MQLDLAAVLNSLAVGVYVFDTTGAFVAVNDAGLTMLGASSIEELQGIGGRQFKLPNVRTEDGALLPHDWSPIPRALGGENVVHVIEVWDRESGAPIILRTRTTPLRDSDGKINGAVKLAVEVTKEYELARIRDEFIRQAAHALKTPLAAIKANSELLAAREQTSSAQLAALVRGVDRIDGLVNSLLDLADLEGGIFSFTRAPVPLQRLLDAAVAKLSPAAARRVKLVAAPVLVDCDETRLRRAFHALIDNALKYAPSSSQVEIAVTREGGAARIAVRDSGYGIPRDMQARVFEKYFRAHEGTELDPGGIGVGLFVAREIIRQHGGTIWFESVEHVGTTFYVELPARAQETE